MTYPCQRLAVCLTGHPPMCYEKGKCPMTVNCQRSWDVSWGGRKDENSEVPVATRQWMFWEGK